MKTRLHNMDKIKVMLLILHFMILEKTVSSLTLKTEDHVFISKEDKNIILNCTYQNSTKDVIPDKFIRWRIMVKDVFKDVAIFSPPKGLEPFIEESMEDLYNNRTELIAPTTSQLSAVMIIKNPVCTDEGTYQCWIQYTVGNSVKPVVESANTSVQFDEAREPTEFLVHPSELEENQSISLTCNADVGRPHGNIQIWKILNAPGLIYTSNSPETENCTENVYVNVTLIFPVTRDDNEARFRCSSQNDFTKEPGPSRDSSKITVIYGPDKPRITRIPPKIMYYVGDPLTIKCTTDSNPPPVFTWSFRPYNKSEEMPMERFKNKTKLVFNSVQTNDAGTYTCTVINTARPSYPNMTSFVSIYVNNSKRIKSVCDQCGYFKTCQQSNEKTVCVVNIWMPIAVVCILLSATFAVSSFVMIRQRKRTRESNSTNNILIENRSPPPDATPEKIEIHGGYISPEDLEFGCPPLTVTREGNGAAYSRL